MLIYNFRKGEIKIIKRFISALVISVYTLGFLLPLTAQAFSSSLYLTPSSTSQTVGSNFTINLGVNANGNAVNAFQATVNIPTNILTITGATGGSLCSIWVKQPTISGSTVSFACGVPGGTTSSGSLISISLRATSVGSGSASISGAKVLAGPGTDVTGGVSGASFNVVSAPSGGTSSGGSTRTGTTVNAPQATPSPTVTSSSHPNQNVWYKNKDVKLAWNRPGGVTGYSYVFDQNPGTVPGTNNNTNSNNLSFDNKADGVWYLHIRANGPKGWSNVAHYRIQIDSTAPKDLTVNGPSRASDVRPTIKFSAADDTSGIEKYEIKLDNGSYQRVSSPYTPERISSGNHTFIVRAYDKAGNFIEKKIKITITEVPAPKISTPISGATFKKLKSLTLRGVSEPSSRINIYIDGKLVANKVKVDSKGNWVYEYAKPVLPGSYQIKAVAVKDGGIESRDSNIVKINVDPSAVSILGKQIPSRTVIITLTLVILVLLGTIGLQIYLFVLGKR